MTIFLMLCKFLLVVFVITNSAQQRGKHDHLFFFNVVYNNLIVALAWRIRMDSCQKRLCRIHRIQKDPAPVLQHYDSWPFDRLQEKERDSVLMEIERDRVRQERDQALDDLQNVERSFRDIQR